MTERQSQWGRLYTTANALVAVIGAQGDIDSRANEVASLMDALHDLDGGQWMPGLMPASEPASAPSEGAKCEICKDRTPTNSRWCNRCLGVPESAEGVKEWRCFHCDDVFTTTEEAKAHFGENNNGDPTSCLLAQLDGKNRLIDELVAKLAATKPEPASEEAMAEAVRDWDYQHSGLEGVPASAPSEGETLAKVWFDIVKECAEDAKKNAKALEASAPAEARARTLAAQYLFETALVILQDERHAETLEQLVRIHERTEAAKAALAPTFPALLESKAVTDEEIMEVGFRHFKPDPDVTPTTRGAFIAAVREVLALSKGGAA